MRRIGKSCLHPTIHEQAFDGGYRHRCILDTERSELGILCHRKKDKSQRCGNSRILRSSSSLLVQFPLCDAKVLDADPGNASHDQDHPNQPTHAGHLLEN